LGFSAFGGIRIIMKSYCFVTASKPDYRIVAFLKLDGDATISGGCRFDGTMWIYRDSSEAWAVRGVGYQGPIKTGQVPLQVRKMLASMQAGS
jgi:hypothetical protein